MSDTSKATPRPWVVVSGLATLINSGGIQKEPWRIVASTHVYYKKRAADENEVERANAAFIVEAVNSYNPKRDRLAQELAARLLDGSCPCTCMTCRLNIKKARQLLKLYEQDK